MEAQGRRMAAQRWRPQAQVGRYVLITLDRLYHLGMQGVSGPLGLFRHDLDTQRSSLFLGLFILFNKYVNVFNKDQIFIRRIFYLCLGRD